MIVCGALGALAAGTLTVGDALDRATTLDRQGRYADAIACLDGASRSLGETGDALLGCGLHRMRETILDHVRRARR